MQFFCIQCDLFGALVFGPGPVFFRFSFTAAAASYS